MSAEDNASTRRSFFTNSERGKAMRKKKFSFRRVKARVISLKNGALECIKTYPDIRRENSVKFVDIVSIVCMLGVSAVTVIFALGV